MNVTLSVAISGDNHIDDNTNQRLVLSTPGDWAEVYRLRAQHDAILIGGETLRRDNPSLRPKGGERAPLRVVVSGCGDINADMKIFTSEGGGRVVVFSQIPRPTLDGLADVVVREYIDVPTIITELEHRGVSSLFVEGGAQILKMFLDSGEVNSLRVACNPTIIVNDADAPSFDPAPWIEGAASIREQFERMEVSTYTLSQRGVVTDHDREMIRRTVEVSRQSPPKDSCYRVGAVIETLSGEIFEGYTLETSPTHHAEQAAIIKAQRCGASLVGAAIYSSIEPCSSRVSEPKSCSELIMEYGFSRVRFALYEPSHFVVCCGAENLRRHGVDVAVVDAYAEEVLLINNHLSFSGKY